MLSVFKAKDIEKALSDFAEKQKITDIVMGESMERNEQQNMINRLQDQTELKVRFLIVPVQIDEENDIIVLENVMS